ncbi:hypothetical protein BGZ80_004554 [Entomortierella chlamydospora]|uniref:Uncharacterized protein n=1 Tax=Entomortierella chlamydospora TaxID=101097 RepID=A0A9P6T2F0_9FUNG|nr:hypothetical protein BGZ80_004554 [Entomortierella chlamydospora]
MPGMSKEFDMNAFGSEAEDVGAPAVETATQQSFALPKITDHVGDTGQIDCVQSTNLFLIPLGNVGDTGSICGQKVQEQQNQSLSNTGTLSLDALQQCNDDNVRQDQSLLTTHRTPGTPATPASNGLATPHSARTSYFPATPASGNTFTTNSTNHSIRTTSTAAFGGGNNDHSHQEETVSNGLKSNEQHNQMSPMSTSPVPEARRQRYNRSEIPPAIVTNPSLAAQRLQNLSTSQGPSIPHTPAIFAARINYPTSASLVTATATATTAATPKTPSSTNEWRMMQMQLQQQDDLHFSLALPSVSSFSASVPNTRVMSAFGQIHVPGSAAPLSASSSTCSCCYNNPSHSPSANASTTPEAIIAGPNFVQSPTSAAPTFGNATPGPDTATQYHSFLLHPNSPANVLAAAAALESYGSSDNQRRSWVGSAVYQHHPNHSGHHLHSNGNLSTTSSDYFSSREQHAQGMPQGHGLRLAQASLASSPASLQYEYTPSSMGSCEYDHPADNSINNNIRSESYGPDSAGSEARLGQFVNYPYLPAPTSAVGGDKVKHCRNCRQNISRRPSMAKGANTADIQTPISTPESTIGRGGGGGGGRGGGRGGGEHDMDVSVSSTSLAGCTHSDSIKRRSSPSPGLLRSLSSRLAANSIRKMSASQKSLFSNSDLSTGGVGCQCCQENASCESFTESRVSESHTGGDCNGCSHHGARGCSGNKSSSICSESDPNACGNKIQRAQSKLRNLRGVTGSKRGRKEKNGKSTSKPYEMEYNFSSQFVRQEFAQYNYERQIEDFQRAARVFKEQKALTTAAAAASLAAEARAAVTAAAAAAAATTTSTSTAAEAAITKEQEEHQESTEKSPAPTSSSVVITSDQEKESLRTEQCHSSDSCDVDSATLKGRRKSVATSARSGTLGSVSSSQRHIGANPNASAKAAAAASGSSKRGYGGNLGGGGFDGSRRGSVHQHGKTDSLYLELGQVGMGMGSDLKLPGLGLGNGFGLDETNFDPCTGEATSIGNNNTSISRDVPGLDVRTAIVPPLTQDIGTGAFDDIIASSPTSLRFPWKPDDANSLKGRPSNVSQDARDGAGIGTKHSKTGSSAQTRRSVHSICSADVVSQQIAARHHQHSRLAATSNVASIHSQSQAAMNSNCETISDGNNRGRGVPRTGAVLENSPIQVVRATVGTVDDPSLPCFTFRMWVLSTIFVVMGAAISEYNFFRSNSAYFSIYFVQLASYFCGKAMAKCLPTREFEICIPGLWWVASKCSKISSFLSLDSGDEVEVGVNSGNNTLSEDGRRIRSNSTEPICGTDRNVLSRPDIASGTAKSTEFSCGAGDERRQFSWKFTLNPGKFNMKEHMLIGIAAAAGCSPAYASNVIAIQSLVFSSPLGSMTGIGLVISSQFIGFSMAWLLFDYVIKPSVMIWPAALWLPRMFMPVLTSMALLCWIKPSSNVLRKLGSGYTGLGIGCISLDWSIVSGVGPLYTPWWAQCNFFIGLIGMLWVITPIVYFSNYWSAMSYPIVSSNLYDNSSQLYDISKIVNRDLSFNVTMYDSYSPVIMTPYFAITYGTSFMAVIATFVHVALFYGSDILLIARTRCSRRMARAKGSLFCQLVSKILRVPSDSPVEQEYVTPTYPTVMMSQGVPTTERGYSFSFSGRRDSESTSSRNGMIDGGVGIGSIGTISDEPSNFNRSSHYRRLSQPQDNFITPLAQVLMAPQPRTTQPTVDDRDQIPTEMFGTEDIHTSLMRAYPEIPGWWFGAMFVICFAIAVLVCDTTDIRLPVYALVLALLLAAVFAIPMAIIQALSSSQIGLNVLSEVVCGYLLPGNQLGNSVFKCYSYMALYQCLNLTQGFKLGHYMKVPPRKIFIAVIYGTLVGAFVNLQVLEWVLLYNRQALFDADPSSGWSFRNLDLFFSASLLWGAISPTRLFSGGSIYFFLPYCFILGVLLPIPFYIMFRHYPPYGTMCKGNSPFPFLPKCTCPASHIAASSEGDATPALPKTRRGSFHDMNESNPLDDTIKEGRSCSSGVFGHCWPFSKSGKRQQHGDLGDKSINLDSMPGSSSRDNNNNGNGSTAQLESEPSVSSPHVYYGNPDSIWEHRLRRFPWHLVNTPLICMGASFVPQAPASFVVSAGIVAFVFAFLVLRYRHEWWRRYTFVLAAALDAGTQICNMAIFVVFSLILKGSVAFPTWYGNDANNPEKCGVGDGYN